MPEASETAELIALIDRLEALLAGSHLSELEVEVGDLALTLRTAHALAGPVGGPPLATGPSAPPARGTADPGPAADDKPAEDSPARPAVLAPLTGLYYSAPSPGAEPYVRVGSEIHVGQVIGLIEAMKLFNEIKSDVAGRVVRICVSDGGLVKAKQPLIEVEP